METCSIFLSCAISAKDRATNKTQSTDHSRECVPWLILGKGVKKINLGTKYGFNHIAAAVASLLGVDYDASCADVTKDILES